MQLIDTHAHIYENDFQHDLTAVLADAQQHGVSAIYMPNIDETTIERMLTTAMQYPTQCYPMIGIHPCYIKKDFTKQLYQVVDALTKHRFIAIGEIGIDLYHDTSLAQEQQEAFSIQLDLAKQHKLPISIHCRNGFQTMFPLLEKAQDGSLKGVIHCFSGDTKEAMHCIELGFHLGITGILTRPNHPLANTLTTIGLQHCLLETDSPYLTPVPLQSKRNEPAYLIYIAEALAAVKGVTLEMVASTTTENAQKLFGVATSDRCDITNKR